jgi:hypothetical protein
MPRSNSKVRLKLVGVGPQRLLYLRAVGYTDKMHANLMKTIIGPIPDDRQRFDGEVFQVYGSSVDAIAKRAAREANAVYQPVVEGTPPNAPA